MEDSKIIEFAAVNYGYDCSYDSGYDDGSGSGNGSGSGSGNGYGYESGYGSGYGSGCGEGDGSGYGSGYVNRSCHGFGNGYGYESGYGFGDENNKSIKTYNRETIYMIDDVPTIIKQITMGYAKGYILNNDFTLMPCVVVKQDGIFAHGETLHEARDALMEKLFDGLSEEERIAEFVKAHKNGKVYLDKDFFDWHHKLTGSCEMGRMSFAKNHGLEKLDGSRTVQEFIELCENDYGGSVIKKLWEYYPKNVYRVED